MIADSLAVHSLMLDPAMLNGNTCKDNIMNYSTVEALNRCQLTADTI